ncbi:hypothetical protein [Flavimaricola marinus]|uniref:Uncharacterized protein n=1 Tax=Flavimaricola marinus TaxID=1819565 RepID=A0A238LAS2_9RHOB|nr:hypothetical protein [Flavimaricola marinus]SMY06524.1 hypothetical protein LOM8899_00651 [Flavimaricola marinus]
MKTFRRFLAANPIGVLIFVIAIGAALTFGVRFGSEAWYFRDPAHREQTLESWMTPRYVGMSWGLPKEVIGPLMNLDPDHPRDGTPPTLDEVTADLGISLEELQQRIEAAKTRIEAERAAARARP